MLRAGALIYALVVALVVGLLSSGLVFFAFHTQLSLDYNQQVLRLTDNANSGIQYLLAQGPNAQNSDQVLDLYGNQSDTVRLTTNIWGVFYRLTATAIWRKQEFSQVALAGQGVAPTGGLALYLADQNQPLSLCGRTLIKGRCQLPKAGAKRAYIEGQNFVGNQLISGTVSNSKRQIPGLTQTHFKAFDYLDQPVPISDSLIRWENLSGDSLSRSFHRSTAVLYSEQALTVGRQRFSGNVRIVSLQSVVISRDARLQSVVVSAPQITVEKGFRGSVQLFARDSIKIGEEAYLEYPSAVVLQPQNANGKGGIFLEESATVAGAVLLPVTSVLPRSSWLISIGPQAEIRGQVYAGHQLELKGKVLGSVWVRQLYLKTPASVYGNHLLNATIDRSQLSPHFVGISLQEESQHYKIAQWLE